jgi:hypothetical protein
MVKKGLGENDKKRWLYDKILVHLKEFAPHDEEFSSLKFSISFQVVKFILDVFKTFVNTLCYNNDENCDIFKF